MPEPEVPEPNDDDSPKPPRGASGAPMKCGYCECKTDARGRVIEFSDKAESQRDALKRIKEVEKENETLKAEIEKLKAPKEPENKKASNLSWRK